MGFTRTGCQPASLPRCSGVRNETERRVTFPPTIANCGPIGRNTMFLAKFSMLNIDPDRGRWWIAVAVGTVLLLLAVLILARTRWAQRRPIATCVVLSVFAHALLIGCLGLMQLFDGPPPLPGADTIYVTLSEGDDLFFDEPAPESMAPEATKAPDLIETDIRSDEIFPDEESPAPEEFAELPPEPALVPPELTQVAAEPIPDIAPLELIESPVPEEPRSPAPEERFSELTEPAEEVFEQPQLAEDLLTDHQVDPDPTTTPAPIEPAPIEPAPMEDPLPIDSDADTIDLDEPPLVETLEDQSTSEILSSETGDPTPPPKMEFPELDEVNKPDEIDTETDSLDEPLLARDMVPVAPSVAPSIEAAPPSDEVAERSTLPAGDQDLTDSSWDPHRDTESAKTDTGHVIPERYRLRTAEGRRDAARRLGGSAESEAAVEAALAWLVGNQSSDGRWDASDTGAGRVSAKDGQIRGRAGLQADTGITGLALLALLGTGHTHQQGSYASFVGAGLNYLVGNQHPSGHLGGAAGKYARMYCHGFATLALSEALAMSGDQRLKPSLRRAIQYTLNCQDQQSGGWRYGRQEPGDLSQFGWQLMALTSAHDSGVLIPSRSRMLMGRFLQSTLLGDGALACYRPNEQPTVSMTAEAMVCRALLDHPLHSSSMDLAAAYVMKRRPGTGGVGAGRLNLYFWYYASMALSQRNDGDWRRWNDALHATLLPLQKKEGPLAGSWDPATVWGGHGGRVYSTAMAALCLEVYYRYLPLYERNARK